MKMCAACHEDLPKDRFSKKQWKLGADCKRRCTSCVAENREVLVLVQPPPAINNESDNNNTGIVSLLDSMSIKEMPPTSDEDLFKVPPQNDDECPICFLRMPLLWTGRTYKSCCGKFVCSGCIYANRGLSVDQLCPFCRAPAHSSDKELIKRNLKRIKANDAIAIYGLGCIYDKGSHGLRQNHSKALELWHRAGEQGSTDSYYNIGNSYLHGRGVERDMEKAQYYWELAAMGGDALARHNLGVVEHQKGNMDRALKHYMISVGGGYADSLKQIKRLFTEGHAAKDDYTKALRLYQAYLDEIRSDQRDKAAVADENYKYY